MRRMLAASCTARGILSAPRMSRSSLCIPARLRTNVGSQWEAERGTDDDDAAARLEFRVLLVLCSGNARLTHLWTCQTRRHVRPRCRSHCRELIARLDPPRFGRRPAGSAAPGAPVLIGAELTLSVACRRWSRGRCCRRSVRPASPPSRSDDAASATAGTDCPEHTRSSRARGSSNRRSSRSKMARSSRCRTPMPC